MQIWVRAKTEYVLLVAAGKGQRVTQKVSAKNTSVMANVVGTKREEVILFITMRYATGYTIDKDEAMGIYV